MTDPNDLMRRAVELTETAEQLDDPAVRDRLLRMAGYYASIAEHERWLAESSDISALPSAIMPSASKH